MPNLSELKLIATQARFHLYRYAMDWNKQMERGEFAVPASVDTVFKCKKNFH